MKKVFLIAFVFILLDQLLKFYIKLNFEYGEYITVFGQNWFQLRFIENPGMAYGIELGGEFGKIALTIIRFFLILAGIFYAYRWIKKNPYNNYLIFPIGLLVAGAIGNLIDSMFYGIIFDKGLVYSSGNGELIRYYTGIAQANFNGYSHFLSGVVVDMLYFPLIETTFPEWFPVWGGEDFTFFRPIFNIADSCITIGITFLFIFRNKAFPNGWN